MSTSTSSSILFLCCLILLLLVFIALWVEIKDDRRLRATIDAELRSFAMDTRQEFSPNNVSTESQTFETEVELADVPATDNPPKPVEPVGPTVEVKDKRGTLLNMFA